MPHRGGDWLKELERSQALLKELSAEFLEEAYQGHQTIERERELKAVRRRAALRLIPGPKMGYEAQYWKAAEASWLDE